MAVTRAPECSNATRASAQSSISSIEKQIKATPRPVRRSSRGRLEAKSDFKLRIARFSILQKQRNRDLQQARFRIAELNKKEKVSTLLLEGAREERTMQFIPGLTGQALARTKKRGQIKLVEKTASRRGRKTGKTVTVVKKIAGRSCSARTSQDVSLLSFGEASCELESKKISQRPFSTIVGVDPKSQPRQSTRKINEREARLIVKLAKKKKPRGKPSVLEGLGIGSKLVRQAQSGLAPLDVLNRPSNFIFETKKIGGRTTGRIVTTKRSRLDGTSQNLLRNRANFIFGGGSNAEFNAITLRDVRNRKSGAARRRVTAVSGGRTILNRSRAFDPFLGRFIF